MEKSPDAFRTISEVADWLDTPAHVLRFWESRFTQVKPVKRAGGRRYYRPSDMALLGGIKKLLHEDGLTIRGVQKILRSEGVKYVSSLAPALEDGAAPMAEDAEEEPSSAEVLVLKAPPQVTQQPKEAAAGQPAESTADTGEDAPVPPAPVEGASVAEGATDTGRSTEEKPGPASEPSEPLVLTPDAKVASARSAMNADAGERQQSLFEFDTPEPEPAEDRPMAAEPEPAPEPAPAPKQEVAGEIAATPVRAAEQDAAAEPAAVEGDGDVEAPAAPAAVDLSVIPEVPDDSDPRFTPPHSAFPLKDARAARAALASRPAEAAKLYTRLIELRERMAQRGR